jgi:hypothetical protein
MMVLMMGCMGLELVNLFLLFKMDYLWRISRIFSCSQQWIFCSQLWPCSRLLDLIIVYLRLFRRILI